MDDIYDQSLSYLCELLPIQDWPEMRGLLLRAYAGKPPQWQLPVVAGLATGGRSERFVPAVAALACSQISILLIDDLLDDDARGEHRRIGIPAAANLASAFQAASLEAATRSDLEPLRKAEVIDQLNQMFLNTAIGQYLDVQAPEDEAAYWKIVRTKSSPYFGTAIQFGALFGGASQEISNQLRHFGDLYGEMIQIHDDLTDTFSTTAGPDWTQRRSPLPILFAEVVNHPDRQRFLELRRGFLGPEQMLEQLEEAQSVLIRCGAVSYCIDQLLRRYRKARHLLVVIPLHDATGLQNLLNRMVDPVLDLLHKLGWDHSELLSSFEISRDSFSSGSIPS